MMRHSIYLLLLLACPALSAEPVYTWQYRSDDPDRAYLYRDGKQIGGWCYRTHQYRSFDGENWGQPTAFSPVLPPQRSSPAKIVWQSQPSGRLFRPIGSRMGEAMGQILADFTVDHVLPAVGKAMLDAMGKATLEALKATPKSLYLIDLDASVKLFAHIELGGTLKDNMNRDDELANELAKELMANGSARIFISERSRFAEKLKEQKFSNPVLASIHLDIEDRHPNVSLNIGSNPEAKWQPRMLILTSDWRSDPQTPIDPATPAVKYSINRRLKDPKTKEPVTVHCSLVFNTTKDGNALSKTLSFDLYLETLERQKDKPLFYPWKVKNVEYK
jgi:hypothetical protein